MAGPNATTLYANATADAIEAPSEFDITSEDAEAQAKPAAVRLQELLNTPNIAATLEDEQLTKIAHLAIEGYELDDASREEWKQRTAEAMKLAMLLADEETDLANVKHPLVTVAAIQFNARAYPAIVQGDRVAKCKVNGHDDDGQKEKRAERVSEHMSWQLTSEMPEWEEDTDRLLLMLPVTGSMFRKRYWDPTLGRQCSRLLTPDRVIINYRARSIGDVPRITEELMLYPYEIDERIRDDRFLEFDYGDAKPEPDDKGNNRTDDQAPHKFIEQHRLIDLDGDEYPEPYIVTVHVETQKVCRIVPNFTMDTVRVTPDGKVAAIRKQDFYVQYTFMQSPDGGIYGMGFGWLLLSTNEAINAALNSMLDAGHLSNIQGGFVSANAGIREKKITLKLGEWKVVPANMPLNQAIMPITYPGPTESMMKLLAFLIEMGKDVANTKDVLTGEQRPNQTATATMALIEQGMKVFNAIFKRVHRAIKAELTMQARLNYEHLTPEAYNAFFDGKKEQYDPKVDYDLKSMDVTPLSDPSISTQMQAMAKAQVTREIGTGKPYIDQMELDRRAFAAAGVEDIDKLFLKAPPPDPFADAMKKMTLLELKAKIEKLETAALLDVANAEKADAGKELSVYDFFLKSLETQHNMEMQTNAQAGPGGLPGMAAPSGDGTGDGASQGAGGSGQNALAGPALQPTGGQPASPMDGSTGSVPQGAM